MRELLTLYAVERWLARLSVAPHAEQFVLKGGMLLAAYDARRPTADVDALARHIANDQEAVGARIAEIADQPVDDDGVEFLTDTAVARPTGEAFYPGVGVAMDSRIATAAVRFRLDINFGDPVTPAPRMIELPHCDRTRHRCRYWAIRSRRCWQRNSRPRSCWARRTPASVTTPTPTR
jgi:hypothetical protein